MATIEAKKVISSSKKNALQTTLSTHSDLVKKRGNSIFHILLKKWIDLYKLTKLVYKCGVRSD